MITHHFRSIKATKNKMARLSNLEAHKCMKATLTAAKYMGRSKRLTAQENDDKELLTLKAILKDQMLKPKKSSRWNTRSRRQDLTETKEQKTNSGFSNKENQLRRELLFLKKSFFDMKTDLMRNTKSCDKMISFFIPNNEVKCKNKNCVKVRHYR
jgi:hypothetical protein